MLRYLLLFSSLLFIAIVMLTFANNESRLKILADSYQEKNSNISKIIDKYKVNSDVTFENLINTPNILRLLEKSNSTEENIQQIARVSIYNQLQRSYENLKNIANIRQLHFHLPDGRSFLRMHRPKKFGDPLFDVRYSVKKTNQQKVFSQGFEEGRIFNGYRFVYPINNKLITVADMPVKHLGSVEISISMAALVDSLKSVYKQNFCFMLNSKVIDRKIFNNEKANYYPSIFGTSFAVDKGVDYSYCQKENKLINELTKLPTIKNRLQNMQKVSELLDIEGAIYTLHMLPIQNVEAQSVAYLFTIFKDHKIGKLHSNYINRLLLMVLLFIAASLITFYIRRYQKLLEDHAVNLEQQVLIRTEDIKIALKKEQCIRRLLETVSDVSEHLSIIDKIEYLLSSCCSRITLHDDFLFSHIKLLNGRYDLPISQNNKFSVLTNEDLSSEKLSIFYKVIENDENLCKRLRKGEIFIHNDLSTFKYSDSLSALVDAANVGSILLIPIMVDDIYIGLMTIFSSISHRYEEEKIIFKELSHVVSQSILSLENKHAKQEMITEKLNNYQEMIYTLVDMTEKRDSYTAGHTRRVSRYCLLIGRAMKLSENELKLLEESAMLHDIGKIITPDSILLKPGTLGGHEYSIIQDHVTTGVNILESIPYYHPLKNIMMYHHERYDGQGYPFALKADEIPLLSRILTVADAFDAMTTNRIYKPRKNIQAAFDEIILAKGKQFDPDIADIAVIALKDVDIDLSIDQLPRKGSEYERLSFHFKDPITELYNKNYFETVLLLGFDNKLFYSVNIINFDAFHHFIQKEGWEKGNILLSSLAKDLLHAFDDSLIFRLYGDCFVVLDNEKRTIKISDLALFKTLKQFNSDVELSLTCKYFDLHQETDKEKLVHKLDIKL